MAIQTITYGSKTSVAITAGASLASGSAVQSAAVDNTTNKYDDAVVQVEATGSAAGNTGTVDFFVYAALGDTNYTDAASGSDATFTAANRKNAVWLGFAAMNGTALVRSTLQRSVAQCFGGVMPSKWGFIVVNSSGAALAVAGITINYQGITYTVV